MHKKRRLHDGITGLLIAGGVLLGYYVSPLWLLLPGIIGVTLVQSGITGFCPVYYALDKLGIEDEAPSAERSPASS